MSRIKNLLKAILPYGVAARVGSVRARMRNGGVFRYDRKRFLKYFSDESRRLGFEEISARLTFHAHSIEKGLSHDDIRLGFGGLALKRLSAIMHRYNKQGYNKDSLPYINALSVLRAYVDVHRAADHDTDYLDSLLGNLTEEVAACESGVGGAMVIGGESKKSNSAKNFKDLFMNRYSVRSYADSPVNMSDVSDAIEIAMKSPSICNRQSARVRVLTDSETISRALKIQGGLTGYEVPPVLMLITTDTRGFVALTERNQVYVDGGLFAMSLLLSLEYKGLAACPLNTMFTVRQDRDTRKLLGLEPSENIIMYASVGNFKEQNNVPKSFRFSAKDITKTI